MSLEAWCSVTTREGRLNCRANRSLTLLESPCLSQRVPLKPVPLHIRNGFEENAGSVRPGPVPPLVLVAKHQLVSLFPRCNVIKPSRRQQPDQVACCESGAIGEHSIGARKHTET